MIQLENINKQYITPSITVNALKDINVTFRNNEFVAILGPSGGGKTTMLNIIGGLDKYSSGDLIIGGKSTAKYKDSDWDYYRNHSVGFVFQSYNLISHQSVLANVELALTIAGISKEERKKRALEALDNVGLKDQAYKKPNQLSGGQAQRVAIARALVNNPDILLADEPTGALDSESSIVVMDILKQVANNRLVVMVTHNPELAEQYANRIIKLKDGQIIDDSNPYVAEEELIRRKKGKTAMNFKTALALSLNNLMTKKGRTILTAFAGSIGIIGIALVLAISTGVNNYIDEVQTNSLSSYPLSIESSTADLTTIMGSMMEEIEHTASNAGEINETKVAETMFSSIGTNDLKEFKKYINEHDELFDELLTSIKYDYGTTLRIYSSDTSQKAIQLNPSTLFSSMSSSYSSLMSAGATFQEMIDNKELLESQYDVVAGKWPENYDECVLIVASPTNVSDYFLYSIGLRDPQELQKMISDVFMGNKTSLSSDNMKFTYEELLNMRFKVVNPSDLYTYNSEFSLWENMSEDDQYLRNVIDNSMDLKVVGIICPNKDASSQSLSAGVGYLSSLSDYMIKVASESEIVKKQLENHDIDVISGKSFDELNGDSEIKSQIDFSSMIKVDSKKISSAFSTNISENDIKNIINKYISETATIDVNTMQMSEDIKKYIQTYFSDAANNYISEKGLLGSATYDLNDLDTIISLYKQTNSYKQIQNELQENYSVTYQMIDMLYETITKNVLQAYYQELENTKMLVANKAILNHVVVVTLNNQLDNDAVNSSIDEFSKQMVSAQIQMKVATIMANLSQDLIKSIASGMNVDANAIASAFSFNIDQDQLNRVLTSYMSTNSTRYSYKENLASLGYADQDDPNSIKLYFKDFECKETFKQIVDEYNQLAQESGDNSKEISYTDITGILMSSITTIIDAISYVLIAFVSVSLVVSSIMIAIITYISVIERTKEIGILRSLGASKRDVSNVFTAETFIVGLISGLLGVGISSLLCIPINIIVRNATDISSLTALLKPEYAVVLVIISVVLTIVAGMIPSKYAAKCDPVVALRSE